VVVVARAAVRVVARGRSPSEIRFMSMAEDVLRIEEGESG